MALHARLVKFKGTACLTTAEQLNRYLSSASYNWKSSRVTLSKFQAATPRPVSQLLFPFSLCKLMLIGGVLPVMINLNSKKEHDTVGLL